MYLDFILFMNHCPLYIWIAFLWFLPNILVIFLSLRRSKKYNRLVFKVVKSIHACTRPRFDVSNSEIAFRPTSISCIQLAISVLTSNRMFTLYSSKLRRRVLNLGAHYYSQLDKNSGIPCLWLVWSLQKACNYPNWTRDCFYFSAVIGGLPMNGNHNYNSPMVTKYLSSKFWPTWRPQK